MFNLGVRIFSGVYEMYKELNPATLSGAIDVIVVEQPDGYSLKSTPFYVRFGKIGVLRTREKTVDISVNNTPVNDVQMRLDDNGQAYFVDDSVEKVFNTEKTVKKHGHDSPSSCPDIIVQHRKFSFAAGSSSNNIIHEENNIENRSRNPSFKFSVNKLYNRKQRKMSIMKKKSSKKMITKSNNNRRKISWVYGSYSGRSVKGVIKIEPDKFDGKSINKINIDQDQIETKLLPIKKVSFASSQACSVHFGLWDYESSSQNYDSYYENVPDDASTCESNDDGFSSASSTSFSRTNSVEFQSTEAIDDIKATNSSTSRAVPLHIPNNNTNTISDELSSLPLDYRSDIGNGLLTCVVESQRLDNTNLSKKLNDMNFTEISRLLFNFPVSICCIDEEEGNVFCESNFEEQRATLETFVQNPDLLFSRNLVMRVNDKYFDYTVAIPILIRSLVFNMSINVEFVEKICHDKKELTSRNNSVNKINMDSCNKSDLIVEKSNNRRSWLWWSRRPGSSEPQKPEMKSFTSGNCDTQAIKDGALRKSESTMSLVDTKNGFIGNHNSTKQHNQFNSPKNKSLCLTSDILKKLNLMYDQPNLVTFSITTKYQGTCMCQCYIYLWKWSDKIVISDIDGTITRSDVLGHVLPLVGQQWEQPNVAEMYSKISSNGYRLMYLSARAIGQSHYTRDYLLSVVQKGVTLPIGPLLLSPTSLFGALHREVIERKPEVFKIDCLLQIRSLFPSYLNPFYAGFGNKHTDEISYRTCAIPPSRTFTIDPMGQVCYLDKRLKSSYKLITEFADQIFPFVEICGKENLIAEDEFSQYSFWRENVKDVS